MLFHIRPKINYNEFNIEMLMLVLFLMEQYHFYIFIDGGILTGTPNNVSSLNMITFYDFSDISFLTFMALPIFVFLSCVFTKIISKASKCLDNKQN